MIIGGIGATGYPAGYETRRVERNTAALQNIRNEGEVTETFRAGGEDNPEAVECRDAIFTGRV